MSAEILAKEAEQLEEWLIRSLEETRFVNGALFVLASALVAYVGQAVDEYAKGLALSLLISLSLAFGSLVAGAWTALLRLGHADARHEQHLKRIQALKTHEGAVDLREMHDSGVKDFEFPLQQTMRQYLQLHKEHVSALVLAPQIRFKVQAGIVYQGVLWLAGLFFAALPLAYQLIGEF